MKNHYIKPFILGITVLITLGGIILINNDRNKETQFFNYPVNYSLCNTTELQVKFYCNRQNLDFFKTENHNTFTLYDEDKNIYQTNFKSLEIGEAIKYEKDKYYPYILVLKLPFESTVVTNLSAVRLEIENKKSEKLSFNIGNISVVKKDFSSVSLVKSVKGNTKIMDDYSTLDEVEITLSNNQTDELVLKQVELVSSVVKTTLLEVIIGKGKDYLLRVPLEYLENSFIDNVGIILTWDFRGSLYYQLINPYCLFKTSSEHTKPISQTYEVY